MSLPPSLAVAEATRVATESAGFKPAIADNTQLVIRRLCRNLSPIRENFVGVGQVANSLTSGSLPRAGCGCVAGSWEGFRVQFGGRT
ncbi:MAG: hypothetical protein KF774_18185 [Planctomyces sp.]|nr:hypothetical protein [Planctomyces sp.]